MRSCADAGGEAVEFDNLDSWTRSQGLLARGDNLAYAKMIVSAAHLHGLAAAQKNTVQLRADGPDAGFDFALAEECARYDECGAYVRQFGRRVLVVEYRRRDFRSGCRRWGDQLPIILRDRAVSSSGPRARC